MSLSVFVNRQIGPVLPEGYELTTISLRLPAYKVHQLDFLAKELNSSRQSLLSALVDDGMSEVVELISEHIGESEGGLEADQFMNCYVALAGEFEGFVDTE